MTRYAPPEFLRITCRADLTPERRGEIVDCWTRVVNGGGAVIAAAFPTPPVDDGHVAPAVDELLGGLAPEHDRLLVATVGGTLAGWLIVRRERHPLAAHCGVVNHVQTHPGFRGRGIGAALMNRAALLARRELGLERLKLAVRGGVGLEDFYRGLGWVEVGRFPAVLRVAPGDDRDEILMTLPL
ncbi:GNAT family N-acetyltransferase [Streptomyces sp. NPDC059564]|uniref:GNAT family N-acetyltransferase n=1 Tax=Streptomyces sp. NPDC059564 TaxID=3346865 RepID=UPI00367575C0